MVDEIVPERNVPITGEVRFAVVLYGGVSLAIYMNGIAQELLRLVRGSSDLPFDDLSDSEKLYRALSEAVGSQGGRKQVVIDIISGSSAGGINGVVLAKALAIGCKDMDNLRAAWTDKAQIDDLLNDRGKVRGWAQTKESLLNGDHMLTVLKDCISDMKGVTKPLAPTVDLFVTATDLHGRNAPIHVTGAALDEKIHKTVFHFARDSFGRNDFTAENDGMLAFAARCTSAFPVAFAPMRYADMPEEMKKSDYDRFFAGIDGYQARQFADGGYLDKRPFSHATDLIPSRPTALPGERKLLFIDPFPEIASGKPGSASVDFVQNAQLALSGLPRYEVIRDDIRAVTRINRRLDRLGTLQDRWQEDKRKLSGSGREIRPPQKPEGLDQLDLAGLMTVQDLQRRQYYYPDNYPLYHHLRVYGTTDVLSDMVARLAGFPTDSDVALYLRQIVRAWRNHNFSAYWTEGLETEMAYLGRFDLEFRLRRLIDLRAHVDEALSGMSADQRNKDIVALRALIETTLANLRNLASPTQQRAMQLLTVPEIASLRSLIEDRYSDVMLLPTLQARYDKAEKLYLTDPVRPLVNKALGKLGEDLRAAFDTSSEALRAALAKPGLEVLAEHYEDFHWHDVLTLPFLEGSDSQEHAEVGVFRISPADSALNPDPAKLAGIKVGAFGGFLNREWREHDILWGRLDGAERIVHALMSDRPKEERATWVAKLQDRILAEEYSAESGRSRQMALLKARLRGQQIDESSFQEALESALGVVEPPAMTRDRFGHYKAVKPIGPQSAEVARWSGRSLKILSQMIDDLPNDGIVGIAGARFAAVLRGTGGLVTGVTQFALPGSFRNDFAMQAVLLVLLAGCLALVLGPFLGPGASWVGVICIGSALLGWLVLYVSGRRFRLLVRSAQDPNKTSAARLLQGLSWLLVALAAVLMAVGLVTVANHLLA